MRHEIIYLLSLMFVLNISLKAQEAGSVKLSSADSVQLQLLKRTSNEELMLEVIKIQEQIIENLNYKMDYLHENQSRIEMKLDSVLLILQGELKINRKKHKKWK